MRRNGAFVVREDPRNTGDDHPPEDEAGHEDERPNADPLPVHSPMVFGRGTTHLLERDAPDVFVIE